MNRTYLASLHELGSMLSFVEGQAAIIGFKEIQTAKILLATEEALVNIINYGYPSVIGTIEIECLRYNPIGVEVTIRDNGVPYNPLANHLKIDYNPYEPLDQRKPGGIGIFIILRVMDKVTY